MILKALIFDVDGTLADTERDGHRVAFNRAFQDAVDDLTTLMRARINEYELKLSHAALRADEVITRARLLYLQGETS